MGHFRIALMASSIVSVGWGGAAAAQTPSSTSPPPESSGTPDPQPEADSAIDTQAETTSPTQTGEDGSPQGSEIIVTGSRIARAGFEAPTPTKVLDASLIEARGSTSIGEFLLEIPSFRNSQGPQTATSSTLGPGQTSADLRGLGVVRTLTLLDGRRFVPSSATGQVDLNLMPSILVQRVDVVTGGASAAYGSDAVSGVVNVILDKRLQGFKGDTSVGISQEGDNRETKVALAFGTSFDEERGRFIIGGDYVDSQGVPGTFDRDFFREQPGLISYSGARPADAPSRFYTTGTSFINMSFGGLITGVNADLNATNGADVLRGIQFGPGGVPTPFNYGNGPSFGAASTFASGFTGGTPQLFLQNGFSIVVPVKRRAALAHLDYEVIEGLTLFAEASYGRSGANNVSPPVRDQATTGPSATTILRDNAFLPGSIRQTLIANNIASFTLGRSYNDFGTVTTNNQNTTERFVAGFEGDLGGGFKLNGYYQQGRNVLDANVSNLRIEQNFRFAVDAVRVGTNIVCAATQANGTVSATGAVLNRFNPAAAGCVPINVFGVGSPSADAINYVTGDILYRVETEQKVASLTLQGSPFSLGAGDVSFAIGAEYRKEQATATSDEISQRNGFNYSNPKGFRGEYEVKEAFAEIDLPLLKGLPFANLLELNAAFRYTHYSTSGGVETWKVGMNYEPLPGVRFRATRSRDIRAPNNAELFGSSTTQSVVVNPFAGGAQVQVATVNQSSPSLRPEKADTTTAGIVLTPRFLPGLSLSADVYDIDIGGAISSFTPQAVVTNCAAELAAAATPFFCNFVTRAGTTITGISVQLLNIASLRSRGLDLEASYRTRVGQGRLTARAFASYVKDLIFDDGTGTQRTILNGVLQTQGGKIDRAGAVGGFTAGQQTGATSLPHWTVAGTLSYSEDPVTLTVNGRYVGGGKFDATLVGPEDADYSPASPISIGSNRVTGRFYLDATIQFDVVNAGNRKLQFYLVGNNLTNVDPPFPVTAIAGLYDRIGRYYRAGLRFTY